MTTYKSKKDSDLKYKITHENELLTVIWLVIPVNKKQAILAVLLKRRDINTATKKNTK